jgi:magnesium chelatase subunit H
LQPIGLVAEDEFVKAELYRQAAQLAESRCPALELQVLSDRNLTPKPATVKAALQPQFFFGSLLFG